MANWEIKEGNALDLLKAMPDESINCCVTSPPYFGLRDYGVAGQIGLEETPAEYIDNLAAVFEEVRRVLKSDGTCWLNLGDSYANDGKWGGHTGGKHVAVLHCSPIGRNKRYAGLKPKDLIGIPWRVALELQSAGWWLRSDIVWAKPNPMPESVTDRPTRSHEYIFLLAKSQRYFYDAGAIKEPVKEDSLARLERAVSDNHKNSNGAPGQTPHSLSQPRQNLRFGGNKAAGYGTSRHSGKQWDPSQGGGGTSFKGHSGYFKADGTPICGLEKNKRDVWIVPTQGYKEAHFATFPPKLIEPCILAGCPTDGIVLDPFSGAGTTVMVALRLGRKGVGFELNPQYAEMSRRRIINDAPLFNAV